MNIRNLAATFVIALFGFFTLNLGLDYGLRNTVPHVLQRRLLNRVTADVVAIGNSVIASGFDVAAFDRASGMHSINAGLGAAEFAQQYVAWKLVTNERTDIKQVVFGTFDYSVTNTKPTKWTTWHSNNALPFYADPSWSIRYGCASRADEVVYLLARRVPLFTERGGLWTKVETLRRYLGGVGFPAAQINRFGRISDSKLLLEQNTEVFERLGRSIVETRVPLVDPVADLLKEAQQKGIASFMVLMPLPADRRSFYAMPGWKAYVVYLRELLSQTGTRLIEATEWSDSREDFADFVHLSEIGAAKFSTRLSEAMQCAK